MRLIKLIAATTLLLFFSGCGGGGSTTTTPTPPNDPPNDPPNPVDPAVPLVLAHWALDEGGGFSVTESLSGEVAKVEYLFEQAIFKPASEPLWRQNCITNGCLQFTGYSTEVVGQTPTANLSGGFTVSAWIAPRAYAEATQGKISPVLASYDADTQEGFVFGTHRYGAWGVTLGLGNAGTSQVLDTTNLLPRNQWSHIAASYDASANRIRLFLNGSEVVNELVPDGSLSLSAAGYHMGQHPDANYDWGLFPLQSYTGLVDEVRIHEGALGETELAAVIFADTPSGVPSLSNEETRIDPAHLFGDKHRPQYHLIPESLWMNEPHAPLYYNGKYHLFFQKNPIGAFFKHQHWGHWVSDDMVRWEEVEPALYPGRETQNADLVGSGSAALDAAGNPVLLYTSIGQPAPTQRIGLARPDDVSDSNLTHWQTLPQAVIEQNPGEGVANEFRDPFVFKDSEENRWYALITSGSTSGRGSGTALVYDSTNLENWTYRGELFSVPRSQFPQVGTIWELPVLLPIGEATDGDLRYAFMINAVGAGSELDVYYWIGRWNKNTYRFVPDQQEPQVMDLGQGFFTGPSGFVDTRTGEPRSILFTIAQGARTAQFDYYAGWAHNGGLPVRLWLGEDDQLRLAPIAEIETLRDSLLLNLQDVAVNEAATALQSVQGDMLEVELHLTGLSVTNPAQRVDLFFRKSGSTGEQARVSYVPTTGRFFIDRSESTLDPDLANNTSLRGGIVPASDSSLRLRLFVDRSMVEAYVNERRSLTSRVFPVALDATGLDLQIDSATGVRVQSLKVWRMNPVNEGALAAAPSSVDYSIQTYSSDLPNHDFSSGDLAGWQVVGGNAFSDGDVSTETVFWNRFAFNFSGVIPGGAHLWGFAEGGDEQTGELRSQDFLLGGDGQINFLVSGGRDAENLYIALVESSTSEELFRATGHDFEQYRRIYWNAAAYIGKRVFIRIVDNSEGGFGHINVDDVHVRGQIMP